MGALIGMARGLLARIGGRSLATVAGGPGRRALVGTVGGLGAFEAGSRLFGGGDGGGELGVPRRRRRRNMFTSTDLAQFAAIEAIAGKKAVTSVMMIRAAKA